VTTMRQSLGQRQYFPGGKSCNRYDPEPWELLANVRLAEVEFDRLQSGESRRRALASLRDAWADLDAWYDATPQEAT